jgi:hypothetical protein
MTILYVQPTKLYTLEGRPPSAFVRPVVGEGTSTLTDIVQNSRQGIGKTPSIVTKCEKQPILVLYFPKSPLILSKLRLNVSCRWHSC